MKSPIQILRQRRDEIIDEIERVEGVEYIEPPCANYASLKGAFHSGRCRDLVEMMRRLKEVNEAITKLS